MWYIFVHRRFIKTGYQNMRLQKTRRGLNKQRILLVVRKWNGQGNLPHKLNLKTESSILWLLRHYLSRYCKTDRSNNYLKVEVNSLKYIWLFPKKLFYIFKICCSMHISWTLVCHIPIFLVILHKFKVQRLLFVFLLFLSQYENQALWLFGESYESEPHLMEM